MTIYVPKKIVPLSPTKEKPLFFLAGPIRGGGDWQAQAAQCILSKNVDALIACPSRWTEEHQLAKHFFEPFGQAGNRQLHWEQHYLKQAGLEPRVPGCIIFWLGLESETDPHPGPEPYAMDTRREIGKFPAYTEMKPTRLVVGGHQKFYGLDVILTELEEACDRPVKFHEQMGSLVEEAYKIALKL